MDQRSQAYQLFIILIFMCAIALGSSFGLGLAKKVRLENAGQDRLKDELKQRYPIVDSTESEPLDPTERAQRLRKNKKYNVRTAVIGPELVQTSEGYQWPLGFNPLPVANSEAIVVGRILDAKAHLSEDRKSVYSEFTFRIENVLFNRANQPLAAGGCITLERKGGRVRFPSGHVSWFFVVGQDLPQTSAEYVLFLNASDEGSFNILTGYELRNGRVEPLDYSPKVVGFQKYSGAEADALIQEIRSEIEKAR